MTINLSMQLRDRVSLPSKTATSRPCPFHGLPLEILEMLFGACNIKDLPNLLQTGKFLRDVFHATRYSHDLQTILKYSPKAFKNIYIQYKRNGRLFNWTVHEFLRPFLQETCECGKPANFVMWFSEIPRKLCDTCRAANAIPFYYLSSMKRYWGLKSADIKDIPIIFDFQADSGRFGRREGHLAEVATLREIALRKSQNFKDRTWTFDDDGTFPGFTELGYLDPKTRQPFFSLNCKRCFIELGLPLPYSHQALPHTPCQHPLILHKYENLRDHIASAHPDALDAFERGWEKLGKSLQREWLQIGLADEDNPPYTLTKKSSPHFFDGWHTFIHRKTRRDLLQTSSSIENIRVIDEILALQPDEGTFHGCPCLPGFETDSMRQYAPIRNEIARHAMEAIRKAKLKEALEELREKGLEAVYKYLPAPRFGNQSDED